MQEARRSRSRAEQEIGALSEKYIQHWIIDYLDRQGAAGLSLTTWSAWSHLVSWLC